MQLPPNKTASLVEMPQSKNKQTSHGVLATWNLLNVVINMLKIEGGFHVYLSLSKTRKGVKVFAFPV